MQLVANVGRGGSFEDHGSARRQTEENTTVPPNHVLN